jgi:DNA-directed RNA polymerase subunit RPC12/RpoP
MTESHKYNIYVCNRCHHKWLARGETKPIVCPKCKSVYWNKKKKLHYNWHATHKKLVKV